MKNLKIFIYLFIIGFLIFCFYGIKFSARTQETSWSIGVIDFDRLLAAHQLSNQLESIDNKIYTLEERGADTSFSKQKDYLKIQALQKEAELNLKSEISAVQDKLQKEREFFQKSFHKEEEEILKEIRALEEKSAKEEKFNFPQPKKVTAKSKKHTPDEFAEDLVLLRERQITAKRLEMQNQARANLLEFKRKKEAELADYETEILKKNQAKKINLKLKLQTAPDEESRDKILEELKSVEEQEKSLKEIRQAQMETELGKMKKMESEKIESETLAFRKKLDRDIYSQLRFKTSSAKSLRNAELGIFAPEKKALYNKYEQVKGQYQQKMKILTQKYETEFEAKRMQLTQRISSEEKKLLEKSLEQQDYISKAKTAQEASTKKEIEKLKEQRKRIYDRILEDIKEKIAIICRKERISQVIGYYLVNIDCKDLTEQVLGEMEKK